MNGKRATSVDHYNTIIKHLNSGALKPIYYLYGEEVFYLDRLIDKFSNLLPLMRKILILICCMDKMLPQQRF